MASAADSRPVGGAEITIPGADRLIWYFMRISGVLLVVLAGGHIFITHYLNVPFRDRRSPLSPIAGPIPIGGRSTGSCSCSRSGTEFLAFATRSRTTSARR